MTDFDYGKSALIVYNMQVGNPNREVAFPQLVPKIRRLIDAAHERQRPVIYGQHVSLPAAYQSRYYAYWLRSMDQDVAAWSEKWRDGAPATQIIEELKPAPQDLVIKKHVASLFVGTNADTVLRGRGVETLVLCGVTTEHGIESTARHASFLGYMPSIVEDAVAGKSSKYNEYSLTMMKEVFACDLRATEDVVKRILDG